MEEKERKATAFVSFFKETSYSPLKMNRILKEKSSAPVNQADKMFKVFARPNITLDDMRKLPEVEAYIQDNNLDDEILEQVEIQVKYSGYIDKEKNNADKLNRLEGIKIPENFDYSKLKSLAFEAKEKLTKI